MSFKRKQANSQQANGKGRRYFRVDYQKPENMNHAKIRNHRRTIVRDVTDRLSIQGQKRSFIDVLYSTLSLKTRSFTFTFLF